MFFHDSLKSIKESFKAVHINVLRPVVRKFGIVPRIVIGSVNGSGDEIEININNCEAMGKLCERLDGRLSRDVDRYLRMDCGCLLDRLYVAVRHHLDQVLAKAFEVKEATVAVEARQTRKSLYLLGVDFTSPRCIRG